MEQFDARTHETDAAAGPLSLTEAVEQIVTEEHAAAAATNAADDLPWDTTKPVVVEPVEIKLDRVRHMRLPFWALRRFQKATGVSPWDHEKVWGFPPDPDLIIHLIWAACLEEDPTLTVDQVERFPSLDLANMLYIRGRLDYLWGRTNPEAEAVAAGEGAPDPNAGTATSTG